MSAAAAALKGEGNTFFKNKDYKNAIQKYSEAIKLNDQDVTYFSNRSACYAALEMWTEASEDGRSCIMVDKNFVKGYFRQATALKNSGQTLAALEACNRGLGVDSANKDLKSMREELNEVSRMERVRASIDQAKEQLSKGDVMAAWATVDQAKRLAPTDRDLNDLYNTIKPRYERAEKERIGSLSGPERTKNQGDEAFKAANFESAIEKYTKALDSISNKGSDLALKCYGNRAACFKQISNFDATIADCTAVLEVRDNDVKALIRRAQAFEACERYKSALQDARAVISLGANGAGKATYDLANGMQHRLNKVIQQLKSC